MCESNMAEENNAEFSFAAAVRGYHVYRRVRLPHLGQCLKAGRELGNAEDCFAIAVYSLGEHSDHNAKADDNPIVGHLPRELSKVIWYFLLWFLHFPFNLHPNKPSAEFIYFLFNAEWPH